MNLLFVLGAVVAGISLGVQGPVNTALKKKTGAFQATAISFGVGTLLMVVIVLAVGRGDLGQLRSARLWQLLGGLYGAFGVVVTVLTVPVLGAALSSMMILLGQIVTGGVIDAFGLFGSAASALSVFRVAGMVAVVLGIGLIFLGSRSGSEHISADLRTVGMMALAFVSGVAAAIQSPTNASLATLVGSTEATLVSFTVGLIPVLALALIAGRGRLVPAHSGARPWMFVGGGLGVLGIFLNLYVVSTLGVALQVACGMMGQLGAGMAVDSLGLFGMQKLKLNRFRIAGIIVIALGVVLVNTGR